MTHDMKTEARTWYYPLVAFCGFFGTMILQFLITQDYPYTESESELHAILLIPISTITPIVSLVLIHRYNQKRWGQTFWGDDLNANNSGGM